MIILGTNSIKDTGYEVANSCRFNDGDTAYMHRTPSSDGNNQVYTLSVWLKRSALGTKQIWTATYGNLGRYSYWGFDSTDVLVLNSGNYSTGGSTTTSYYLKSKMKFRDISSYYHIVFAVDTTQGSASNRAKLYVNGTQVDFNTADADYELPGSNEQSFFNKTTTAMQLGVFNTSDDPFDGYMAEVCWIDGTQYAASDFGEYDEDSPTIWKPKDVSGLTFGTNGFYLDFEDSGDLGDDESGNGNDLTEVNLAATDQSIDTCTNNFCTINSLDNYYASSDFSEGNLKVSTDSSNYSFSRGTIGVSSGKWYFEHKIVTQVSDHLIGIVSKASTSTTDWIGLTADTWGLITNGSNKCQLSNNNNRTDVSGTLGYPTDGDIIGVYIDLDNNKLYFAKNGTLASSTGQSLTASASTTDGFYFPAAGDFTGSVNVMEFNFGSPTFSISSSNSDPNGYGSFEYSTTITGDGSSKSFYAICTKNLAEFG